MNTTPTIRRPRRVIRTALLALAALLPAGAAAAQSPAATRAASPAAFAPAARTSRSARSAAKAAVWLVPDGDSVTVLLLNPPPAAGFVVYRAPQGDSLVRVKEAPVTGLRQPVEAAGRIGNDMPAVLRMLHTTRETSVLQRLHADPFSAAVLSALYPCVAHVLGRVWVDHGLTPGKAYTYRVVAMKAGGTEGERIGGGTVRIASSMPKAVSYVKADTGDGQVTLTWSYPKYTGAAGDFAIGFHVYRAAAGEPAHAIDPVPVLRNDAAAPRFTDTHARNGVAYTYTVRAFDVLGRQGPGAGVKATPVDHVAPAPPTDLAVRPGEGVVTLVWRMSSELDAAGYIVQRSTGLDEPYTTLTSARIPVDAPMWVDSTAVGGTQYFYRVVAIDRAGNRSRPSNALSAVPHDRTPPAAPTNVRATVSHRRLRIAWTASPSSDVRGYYVYRGPDAQRLVRLTGQPVAADSFVDEGYGGEGLRPGANYVVAVAAVDRSYNESGRVTVQVRVPDDQPPGAPSALHARNVDGRYVELGWSPSPALDVATYVLSRTVVNDTAAGDSVVLGRYPAAARTLAARDTTVALHTRYAYRLVAVDTAGNVGPAAADTLLFHESTPPPAPRWAGTRIAADGVHVQWERVVDRDLAGYYVYRSDVPTGVYRRITDAPVPGLTFVDPSGKPRYYYQVRAVDGSGNVSDPSPAARPAQAGS